MDYVKLYSLLSSDIQEVLTLPALRNPKDMKSLKDVKVLLIEIVNIIVSSRGVEHKEYSTVIKFLPSYVENLMSILIGEDDYVGSSPVYLDFFAALEPYIGEWLTMVMLKKPGRMTHDQKVAAILACIELIMNIKASEPYYKTVALALPKWVAKVLDETMHLESETEHQVM